MGSLTERLGGATPGGQAPQGPAKAATPASTPPTSGPYQWVVIEPDIFPGEDVLFVIDPACLDEARAAHPGLVTYLTSEIDLLWPFRDNKDFIKGIHRVKKHLGGWLREVRPPAMGDRSKDSPRAMSSLKGFMDTAAGGGKNV